MRLLLVRSSVALTCGAAFGSLWWKGRAGRRGKARALRMVMHERRRTTQGDLLHSHRYRQPINVTVDDASQIVGALHRFEFRHEPYS